MGRPAADRRSPAERARAARGPRSTALLPLTPVRRMIASSSGSVRLVGAALEQLFTRLLVFGPVGDAHGNVLVRRGRGRRRRQTACPGSVVACRILHLAFSGPCHEPFRPPPHPARSHRRHRRLQGGRAHAPAGHGRPRRAGRDERGRLPLHHAGHHAGAVGTGRGHGPVGCVGCQRDGTHRAVARPRAHRGCAGQRGFHRQAGQWPRRRPAVHAVPGARMSAAGGPGHEPADVGQRGHPAQRAPAAGGRGAHSRSRQRRPGLWRDRHGAHARGRAALRGDPGCAAAAGAGRRAGIDHRRPDLRGHRCGARHHQPQLGPHGIRRGPGRVGSGRAGHAWCPAPQPWSRPRAPR